MLNVFTMFVFIFISYFYSKIKSINLQILSLPVKIYCHMYYSTLSIVIKLMSKLNGCMVCAGTKNILSKQYFFYASN